MKTTTKNSKLLSAGHRPRALRVCPSNKWGKQRLEAFLGSYIFLASLAMRSFHSALFLVMYAGVRSCSRDSGWCLKNF